MPNLVGHSITYRIAVGPHRGRKAFTLQTLPDSGWEDRLPDAPGNVAGKDLPGLWSESRARPSAARARSAKWAGNECVTRLDWLRKGRIGEIRPAVGYRGASTQLWNGLRYAGDSGTVILVINSLRSAQSHPD